MTTRNKHIDAIQAPSLTDDKDESLSNWDRAIADGAVSLEVFAEELRKQIDQAYVSK